ncbi:MAG: rRNA maturation RNase YbeY [Clostridia bacterium]|nr:rRNA maturation RNase YbeY [Clostridia bacterium]
MKLTVYNRQKVQKISKETLKLIEKAAKLCQKTEGFPYPCEASITLVDNAVIHELNCEHRGIDRPTDVLSFPLVEYNELKPQITPGDIDPETNCVSLGDIIISVEKASEQAQSYGHSLDREFAFLAVHGMLHLLGYDHETKEDERVMFQKQEAVLQSLGLTRE